MFIVECILRRGWWNTVVRVSARQSFSHEERELSGGRPCTIKVRRFTIREGETFDVNLPSSVNIQVSDVLRFETLMNDRSLRKNWEVVVIVP